MHGTRTSLFHFASAAALMLLAASSRANTLYVPSLQYPTIQAAVNAAAITGDEVILADGTYTGDGNRLIDFGGRAISVRSASDNPALCIIDCQFAGSGFLFQNGETPEATVRGVTILNGYWDGNQGGGMYIVFSSPSINNCAFVNCSSQYEGGGILVANGNPTITHCSFTECYATSGACIYSSYSNTTVTDCTFRLNAASGGGGGGMYIYNGTASVTNCLFDRCFASSGGGVYSIGNSSVTNCAFTANGASSGGGMLISGGTTVTNCAFAGNNAGSTGGGVFTSGANTLTNCTFTRNRASVAAGALFSSGGTPTVTNCIFWGDSSEIDWRLGATAPSITYSDVQGGWVGTGNIDADPLFVDPANADLRLQSLSRCIDAGNNAALPVGVTTDLAGNPRTVNTRVDIGAYEDQVSGRPFANAGSDQNVTVLHDGSPGTDKAPVSLDGTGSFDPDGDQLTYAWTDGQGHTATGAQPILNLPAGAYTFTLTVTDPSGLYRSDTVAVTVNPEPNRTPIAGNATKTLDQDTSAVITLDAIDPDGDDLIAYVNGPAHGTLAFGSGLSLIYTPTKGYYGPDSFTFVVFDAYGAVSNTATVNITVNHVNHPPVAINDTATTKKNTAVTINVLANDSDADGDALSVSAFTQPANGTVVKNANNTLTFTPAKNFTGVASFNYTVSDGHGGSASATVTVTVTK